MPQKEDFSWSNDGEPHKQRTKEIIARYPEIRKLIGRNPYTFLIILFCVALQSVIAYFLRDSYWWLVFVLAYCVGAFADHTLYVCIHECSHNMVFKGRRWNTLAGYISNLPLIFASYSSFKKYHLKHHIYLGVPALDADMPSYWEARLVNNSTVKKAIWLLLYPITQVSRLGRLNKETKIFDGEMALNWVVQIIYVAAVFYFCGWKGVIFQLASFFFSVGLHPLGARWIQEHYLTNGNQETKSYYGVLNILNMNVGYHNEHHDFQSVPWNNLPKIKKIASEYYDNLAYHTSYVKLLFQFLFNPKLSVFSRMARSNRSRTAVDAQ